MRMTGPGFFALAALASASAIAAPGIGQERLVSPDLPGYVVGHTAQNEAQFIEERLPEGEPIGRWTRLVTTQRFTGLAARITPKEYAKRIRRAIPQRCPGAKVSEVTDRKVSGRAAIRFEVDCPRGETGRREAFILLAVAGASDMHVRQVAFRGQLIDTGMPWGRQFLKATVLCGAGFNDRTCLQGN